MIEAIQLWNEPANPAFWDRELDPDFSRFCDILRQGADALRQVTPSTMLVLAGLNPFDPGLLALFEREGVLERVDAAALHGYPMDWNLWPVDDWRRQVDAARTVTDLPLWVTEAGGSSFGADEVQAIALRETAEQLRGYVDRVFWSGLFDHPPAWEINSRHAETEGSAYYRSFYLGLVRADGRPKTALTHFDPALGISQWFTYEDPRLESAVQRLDEMGVRRVRTALSWADWTRPDATVWFDRLMGALAPFDTTVVLCFTPPQLGLREHHTAPPRDPAAFAEFAAEAVGRYVRPRLENV